MFYKIKSGDRFRNYYILATMTESLAGKTVLVTGGAGFLGSHMCDALLARGARVVAVDDLSNGKRRNIVEALQSKNFTFIKADANNQRAMRRVFAKIKPHYVMHYAAIVGVNRTTREPFRVFADVDGVRNIAELSRKYKVRKIFFASSSEVYGEPIKLPIREDAPFNVRWPYSVVKLWNEQYLLASAEQYGIPVTITRFFNVYGPRQDFGESGFGVSIFLRNALAGKTLELLGGGKQTRDFVFIEDNIRLCLEAFTNSAVDNKPMNIGSGKSITIHQLAEAVIALTGSGRIVKKPLRAHGEIKLRTPDITLMKRLLHDEPRVPLADGLRQTLAWLKDIETNKR